MNLKKQAVYFKNSKQKPKYFIGKKPKSLIGLNNDDNDTIYLDEYIKDPTEEDVKRVCESLINNEKDYGWIYANILRETGVDIKLIKDIECKKKYKNISEKYNIEDPHKYSKNLTTNEIKSLCFHYEMEPVFGDTPEERRDNCIEGLEFAAKINRPTEEQIREGLLIFHKDIYPEITDKYCYEYDPIYKSEKNN